MDRSIKAHSGGAFIVILAFGRQQLKLPVGAYGSWLEHYGHFVDFDELLGHGRVLQELLGHGQSIKSTGKFSRNSWVTDNQSRLLGSSPGTPGSRTINHVYWEVLQELLGHGWSILSTGKFSRNSWVTDNQSRLLGGRRCWKHTKTVVIPQ
ncbi:hypothetical protein V8G54_032930 [Vigna mungo]|uniref:Uncharacterized protein n=1 Tax=Vigna mungo TaxID=3915 RepID=A0AAQ3MME5_VIGMU